MSYYAYTIEPMPRTDLFAKRDHNPATEYIGHNGIYLDPIPAKTWTKLPEHFKSLRHRDRADKQGTPYHVFISEIVEANRVRLEPRGVIFLDHEPTAEERAALEAQAAENNLKYRLGCVEEYETAMKEAEVNGRTYRASTYVTECYKELDMERPGSVEALRAQRQPGEAAADRFAASLEKVFERFLERVSAARPHAKG